MRRRLIVLACVLVTPATAYAGVVNPDISIIGQPFTRYTNDGADVASKRVTLDPGEVESVFDAALNPYAHGTFILALDEEGLDLEEGYFQILRGLPAGLAVKGGKYRVGFGKLNPAHPHIYPFADRFRVLASYLPGEESLNETGVSVSGRIPAPGDIALTASADWLNGDTYRIERAPGGALNDPLVTGSGDRGDEPRPAFLGRLSGFFPVGERSGIEVGLTGTQGTNNVAASARTTVLGGDVKAKLWSSANSYVVLQGELLSMNRDNAAWDSASTAYVNTEVSPLGGYFFADWNFNARYNVGASYERYQQPTSDETWDQAFKVFAGLALMEETTSLRLDWDHFMPGTPSGATAPDPVDTVTLRVIFSMGPHKAHQF